MINLNALAEVVAARIIAMVDANLADYAEDFNEENLIDQAIEHAIEGTPFDAENPDDLFEKLAIHKYIDHALSEAKILIDDWKSDQDLYKNGPMKAYGLSQKDFI